MKKSFIIIIALFISLSIADEYRVPVAARSVSAADSDLIALKTKLQTVTHKILLIKALLLK